MKLSAVMQVSVAPDVLIREVAGESVIFNLSSERYFGLDEVGTRIWVALTASESIQAAYEVLLTEYDVDPDRLRQDLQDLIRQLIERGLVQVTDG